MENTKKMIIYKNPTQGGQYYNERLDFQGTIEEAKIYAQAHNFGGGVEVYICLFRGKPQFAKA